MFRRSLHCLFCLVLLTLCALPARAELQRMLQMVDYMGVDYAEAVHDGQIVNDGEYAEMQEFSARIGIEAEALPAGAARDTAVALAGQLAAAVARYAPTGEIVRLTRELRDLLMSSFEVALVPATIPDIDTAEALYADQCAICHGESGRGDGAAAGGLEPAPTDFTDLDRARQRSLYGLYNTITQGVSGTAMAAFDRLSPAERWSLAFYIGGLAVPKPDAATAAGAWQREPASLTTAVTLSPSELGAKRTDGELLAWWLRQDPRPLFSGQEDPLQTAQRLLDESHAAFLTGDRTRAGELAISAYLDGFELGEAALSTVDAELMRRTEAAMLDLRRSIAAPDAGTAQVEAQYAAITALLDEGRAALAEGEMSAGVAFTSAFVILLREGLEAILVISAMAAWLLKSGRPDALRWVHGGWIAALTAGLLTWVLSVHLFTISGATRELTEGLTALAAAAILYYVGFWMHRHASAAQWTDYLRTQVQAALSSRTLWTLAVVSFLAVYREVFETILFYQALWLQVAADAQTAVIGGGIVAAAALVLIAWGIARFELRLPLRQLFLASAILMIALAVIFAGQGIAALQEAGRIASHPLAVPRIELIGLFPTVQTVAVQVLMMTLAGGLLWHERRRRKA
jgi:high-affinity iron transporter